MDERVRVQRQRRLSTERSNMLPVRDEACEMPEAPQIVGEVLQSSGQPLDAATRAFMEPRFGHDFSQVRVHTDERAAESAETVDALAYTVGRDVVFGAGQYAPGATEGRQLIAHELAHVIQQRHVSAAGPMTVGPASDTYERGGDELGAAITNAIDTSDAGADPAGPVTALTDRPASADEGLVVQRKARRPSVAERLAAMEQREQKLEQQEQAQEEHRQAQDKHLAAIDLDRQWQGKFGERVASYKRTILRITGGFNAANKAFQEAQVEQAKTDALVMKIVGAALSLPFAAGFGWAFSAGAGALGSKMGEVAETVSINVAEKAEETFVEKVLGKIGEKTGDILAEKAAERLVKGEEKKPGEKGGKAGAQRIAGVTTPAGSAGGDPMALLTSNSEAIESHVQKIEQAFVDRSKKMEGYADDDWLQIDPHKQMVIYQQLYDDLGKVASGVEKLKPAEELAKVLERHLWAHWIQDLVESLRGTFKEAGGIGGIYGMPYAAVGAEDLYEPGSDIEAGLNKAGVADKAGVKLSESRWHSNSPDNWRQLLLNWAKSYDESIGV